jgi:hypothetical protein
MERKGGKVSEVGIDLNITNRTRTEKEAIKNICDEGVLFFFFFFFFSVIQLGMNFLIQNAM